MKAEPPVNRLKLIAGGIGAVVSLGVALGLVMWFVFIWLTSILAEGWGSPG